MKKYLVIVCDCYERKTRQVMSTDNLEVARAYADGFNDAHECSDIDEFADVIYLE